MKTYVKKCGLPAVLLLASALAASADPVTYQINMSVQQTLGNFTPANGDTVLVSGSWDAWSTTNTLTVSGDPNIYTITLEQAASSWPNFKYVINPYGTSSGGDLKWENIANRWFQVPAGGTNLPVVFFDNVTNTTSVVETPVTFEVDLSVQAALGTFNFDTDFVFVAGDFGWSSTARQLTRSVTDTNVWTGTFTITNTVGTTINHKFVMNTFANGEIWESDGVGPGGAQNRQFVLPATATNLPVVYFNNITNSSSLVSAPITFAVNLAVPMARGTFLPEVDGVSVAGDASLNGWNATSCPLTRTETNVWIGTFNVTNTAGTTVNYKFVLGGVTWEDNGIGPAGAQNRQFAFPAAATNLPIVYWNNVGNLGPITNAIVGGQLSLSWASGSLIRLQSAASATGVWNDVPDTLGLGAYTTNTSSGMNVFRLIGP